MEFFNLIKVIATPLHCLHIELKTIRPIYCANKRDIDTMFATWPNGVRHRVLYVGFILWSAVAVHGLRLYNNEEELGSGDFGTDELLQHGHANDLQRTTKLDYRNESSDDFRLALRRDIYDFLDLVPADEVATRIAEYYRNDVQVNHVLNFVYGHEYQRLKTAIIRSKEFQALDAFVLDLGLAIPPILKRIENIVGTSKYVVPLPYRAAPTKPSMQMCAMSVCIGI